MILFNMTRYKIVVIISQKWCSLYIAYLCGRAPTSPSICDLIHRISSKTELLWMILKELFSLMAFPNLASATRSDSCASFDTSFFKSFFNGLETFPSTAAVAAARASVVSVNFSKCFSFTLFDNKILVLHIQY